MQLDVVFVNPGARRQVYQQLGGELTAVEPPTWAGMLATFCRQRGHSVDVIDAEALDLSPDATGLEVAARSPRLAVLVVYGHQPSASTQTMTAAGEALRAIAEHAPEVPTLIVGGHVSALPEQTLREERVDYVCEGEGPQTLAQLLDVLKAGDLSHLSSVAGLWYRDGGRIVRSAERAGLVDLDADLPGIAWDLLPMDRYRAHNWHCFDHIDQRQPYASLYTSLGCPFRCSFCCINAPFGKSGIRYHSPAQVIAELDVLVNDYGVRNLKIVDEMFVLSRRHVEGICDGIIERGYDLNIWAYARIDTVKEGLLPKMKRAGFNWLALGIESGSEHVRDGAEKAFGKADIAEVVRQIQDHGIYVIGNYIFGLPDDDRESMQATLDLALDLNTEFANFYSAMAYPGSPLYRLALEKGIELPEAWFAYSQHAYETLPLATETLSAAEVLRFRDDAFHTYFTSPSYLALVERKFGPHTLAHVREMAGHRLPRKYA
ncbi:MAG: B12-binding domain-containing radical SAM protein [Myxococcota bacterium]